MKRLNLLPQELRQKKPGDLFLPIRKLIKASPAVRLAMGLAGVVLLVWLRGAFVTVRYGWEASSLKKEQVELRSLSGELKSQQQALLKKRSEITRKREETETRLQALRQAQQPPVPLSTVLTELVGVLPEEVWITKMTFEEGGLKIVGASQETQAVVNLMGQLEGSGRFQDTTFAYTQRTAKDQDGAFTFELSTRPSLLERGDG